MFDPLTTRVLVILGASYIILNCVFSYLHCQDNFCPGDRESDWVYEYTDDSGKKYIVVDGKPLLKEQYTGEGK
jgi:hypothetical protein